MTWIWVRKRPSHADEAIIEHCLLIPTDNIMPMAQLICVEFILGRNNLIRVGRFNYAIWDNEEMYRLPLESGMPWYAMQLGRENGVSDAKLA